MNNIKPQCDVCVKTNTVVLTILCKLLYLASLSGTGKHIRKDTVGHTGEGQQYTYKKITKKSQLTLLSQLATRAVIREENPQQSNQEQ